LQVRFGQQIWALSPQAVSQPSALLPFASAKPGAHVVNVQVLAAHVGSAVFASLLAHVVLHPPQ
jgi:hypothetical protein